MPSLPRYAVVLCTRNRVDDLARTLGSIAGQVDDAFLVLVVDASDAAARAANAATVARFAGGKIRHIGFEGRPSLTRQRNAGIDALPPSVLFVHFLDDDVTLQHGYFAVLNARLHADDGLGGVGGQLIQGVMARQGTPPGMAWRRLFLLDAPAPGRVLASGATTPAQVMPLDEAVPVEWLGGCCAYRRAYLARHRFDDALEGYALDEDLDLSYRIGREARLLVDPEAALIHHVSPVNRSRAEAMAFDALVHRYWFVEKNLRHPLRKPAFWWAALGQLLAAAVARTPGARDVLRGRRRALRTIFRRHHPLLRRRTDG